MSESNKAAHEFCDHETWCLVVLHIIPWYSLRVKLLLHVGVVGDIANLV